MAPAVYTVSSFVDESLGSSTRGSLRYCIEKANATAGDHTLNFDLLDGTTINLRSALPPLRQNITINGLETVTVRRATAATTKFRIFEVDYGKWCQIHNLTSADGYVDGFADNGGGIWNKGHLLLSHVELRDNYSAAWGGGIYNSYLGDLTVFDCIISANQASLGGGVCNDGSAVLRAGTVIGANSAGKGGGLFNDSEAEMTVTEAIW